VPIGRRSGSTDGPATEAGPGTAPDLPVATGPAPGGEQDLPASAMRPRRQARVARRARLYVYRVDAWSIMKVAFMLSIAVAIVFVTAVAATWWLLDYSGVFATLARNVDEVIGSGTTTFDLESVLAFQRVFGIAVVVAALEIALVSIMAGLFAILYNLTVGITGGVEVTLSDDV
jgi:hypothetical protein